MRTILRLSCDVCDVLVIIRDLDLGWSGFRPAKADAELVVHPNAELAGPVAFQGL
jgi:hypothetical protein